MVDSEFVLVGDSVLEGLGEEPVVGVSDAVGLPVKDSVVVEVAEIEEVCDGVVLDEGVELVVELLLPLTELLVLSVMLIDQELDGEGERLLDRVELEDVEEERERDAETEGVTVIEEDILGCELPPTQVEGSTHAAHWPEVDAQKTVPKLVDA